MAKRRRSKTPGVSVYFKSIRGRKLWYADLTNPENGKRSRISLRENCDITTSDKAYEWAKRKSEEIQKRERAIQAGSLHGDSATKTLDHMAKEYFDARGGDLSPRTLRDRESYYIPQFLRWAEEAGIKRCSDLTRNALVQFRTWLQERSKVKIAVGGTRTEPVTVETGKSRDPVTLNNCLRDVKAVLNWARKSGYLMLDSDGIKDALEPFKQVKRQKRCLKSKDLRALVTAAKKHDAERMSITRESKDAGKTGKGELPPKYEPVLPFLLLMLLGGFRKGELEQLRWDQVDFESGTIKIAENPDTGWRPKTNEERLMTLKESPALAQLLKKMYANRGASTYVLGGVKPSVFSKMRWKRLLQWAKLSGIMIKDFRSTCATYMICSPEFGKAPHVVASRMGHSVTTLFKHYAGLIHNLEAYPTLEETMGIADLLNDLSA